VPLVRGLAASPGAASGPISFEGAERAVLVRSASSADHVEAMRRSAAVLTASGGLTCHAAVVARALGKPCIVGARSLYVDSRGGAVVVRNPEGDRTLREGDVLTVDGTHGLVFEGVVEREPVAATPAVGTILGWADALRVGKVYAEARDPAEARLGMSFGADGVVVAEGADAAAIREAMPDEVDVLTSAPEGLELAPASAEPMPGRAIRCPPSSVPRERLRAAQAQARVLAEVKDEPG
jgi:phosphoenolpyruvate synthase/pyruvate phosphate dikinase